MIKMIWQISEILNQLTPLFLLNDESIFLLLIEEIGEVVSILNRSQDVIFPSTLYKLTEIPEHKLELRKEQLNEYARWCEFFRFYKRDEKFRKNLSSELTDIIMVVTIFVKYYKEKGIKQDYGIERLLEYKFDKYKYDKINVKNVYNNKPFEKVMEKEFREMLMSIVRQVPYGSKYIMNIGDLREILDKIQNIFMYFDLEVNESITKKLEELKIQKRSK